MSKKKVGAQIVLEFMIRPEDNKRLMMMINDKLEKMSSNTIRKAKKLVESGGVVKIDVDLYQIRSSSDPEKSYFVTSDSCECPGFKNFYKFHHGKGLKANCSHLEAVRIYKKEHGDDNAD